MCLCGTPDLQVDDSSVCVCACACVYVRVYSDQRIETEEIENGASADGQVREILHLNTVEQRLLEHRWSGAVHLGKKNLKPRLVRGCVKISCDSNYSAAKSSGQSALRRTNSLTVSGTVRTLCTRLFSCHPTNQERVIGHSALRRTKGSACLTLSGINHPCLLPNRLNMKNDRIVIRG